MTKNGGRLVLPGHSSHRHCYIDRHPPASVSSSFPFLGNRSVTSRARPISISTLTTVPIWASLQESRRRRPRPVDPSQQAPCHHAVSLDRELCRADTPSNRNGPVTQCVRRVQRQRHGHLVGHRPDLFGRGQDPTQRSGVRPDMPVFCGEHELRRNGPWLLRRDCLRRLYGLLQITACRVLLRLSVVLAAGEQSSYTNSAIHAHPDDAPHILPILRQSIASWNRRCCCEWLSEKDRGGRCLTTRHVTVASMTDPDRTQAVAFFQQSGDPMVSQLI